MNATVHKLERPGIIGPTGPVIPGTCGICGVPHHATDCAVLGRHLEWLRLRGRAATTIYDRGRVVVRLAAALPIPVLDAADPALDPGGEHLLAWRAGLTVSAKSIGTYCMHIRCFYDWAVAEGLIETNPAKELPVPDAPRYLPRPIAAADLWRALAMASPRVRPWLMLGAHAGFRACEVAGLRVDSILFEARPPVLIVAAAATKGGRHERIIPMSPLLAAELRAAHLPSRGLAFPRMDGKPGPQRAWVISRLGCEALHNAGCSDTFHSLRHFFATEIWRASHDLLALQSLLGHANANQCAVYAMYDRTGAVEAVNALPVPTSTAPERR